MRQAGAVLSRPADVRPAAARADANAGRRVCVTFRAGRICLHGMGARIARRSHGTWMLVGSARTTRKANVVTVRAPAGKLRVALGGESRLDGEQRVGRLGGSITGTLRTRRIPSATCGSSPPATR